MRSAHHSTKKAILEARRTWRSIDGVLMAYDVPVSKATIGRALNGGPISLRAENAIRAGLGLEPCVVEVAPCPSCGIAHVAGDCGGDEIADVVILRPGESVKRQSSPSHPRHRATIQVKPATRELLRSVQQPGESFDATIRRLAERWTCDASELGY